MRSGPAPLHVDFSVNGCSGSAFHWSFGDGLTADGAATSHDFAPGAFTVTLSSGGVVLSTVEIDSLALELAKPGVTTYGRNTILRGILMPASAGVDVSLTLGGGTLVHSQTGADGSFTFKLRLRRPGPYVARSGTVASNPIVAPIQPLLRVSVQGARIVGRALLLRSSLRPAAAGALRLVAVRDRRRIAKRVFVAGQPLSLPSSRAAKYTIWVSLKSKRGYTKASRKLHYTLSAPALRLGSHGRVVRLLEQELVAHHYALPRVDSSFGFDTLEAVYALQKLAGLDRTGSMNTASWIALAHVQPPRPRLRGDYVEVDKTKQVLYIVRNGKVALIVPVSTGATGNTPIGLFHVYSKVPGGAVMYYSNFFIGAFAIHGYVDVPPYPASHGCVRIPMWLAIRVYGLIPYNTRVLIHY
ncbi:MAG: L,D-transpeptidase family protein [Gaiellaceae bacterium]